MICRYLINYKSVYANFIRKDIESTLANLSSANGASMAGVLVDKSP